DVLTVKRPVRFTPLRPVNPNALLQFALSGSKFAHHARRDATQVVRLHDCVDVSPLAGDQQAVLGHLPRLTLIATHEMERSQSPQRSKMHRRFIALSTQFTGASERLRGFGGSPASD